MIERKVASHKYTPPVPAYRNYTAHRFITQSVAQRMQKLRISKLCWIGCLKNKEPCLSYQRLTTYLSKALQCRVNQKYERRLMQELGFKAIYYKRNTSKVPPKDEKVAYLLRSMRINKPNMVWTTDITYLKIEGRTYYLYVVMDWASREALGYSIGRNMTVELSHDALTMALSSGRKPETLNTDQGSQFTSES